MGSVAVIVLDTHVWVWWIAAAKELSRRARERIESSMGSSGIYVSSISCWEIGVLVAKGRLELTMDVGDWIARCESLPYLNVVPLDCHIALRSTRLSHRLHDDPADRIIIATALSLGATLVTKDRRIRAYEHVPTLW